MEETTASCVHALKDSAEGQSQAWMSQGFFLFLSSRHWQSVCNATMVWKVARGISLRMGGGRGGSYSTKGSYPKNTNQNAAHARNSADTTENSSIKLSFKMATLCIRMLIKW